MSNGPAKTALITGGARRIGAAIARELHATGWDLLLHYRGSEEAVRALADALERERAGSTALVRADLLDTAAPARLLEAVDAFRGRLDLLVNNASTFYPTPLAGASPEQWEELIGSNLKAPFFIAQALAPSLRAARGAIVNLVDIHAERPLRDHPIYCIAKAGNAMMVKALAQELGPEVRVNGVAPGAILWPEQGLDDATRRETLERIPLERTGTPEEIAAVVRFLAESAGYVTGQIVAVDGGRTVQQ